MKSFAQSAALAALIASSDAMKISKSDSDGMFAFGGENVTRGNLKNLIVDKPSPITVALAQVKAKTLPDAVVAPAFATSAPVATMPLSNEDTKGLQPAMAGTEEVHGAAQVGGSAVTYGQKNATSNATKL